MQTIVSCNFYYITILRIRLRFVNCFNKRKKKNAAARVVYNNTGEYDRRLSRFQQTSSTGNWSARSSEVQSVCPGFQVSAQHGAWVLDVTLPTCVSCCWTPTFSTSSSRRQSFGKLFMVVLYLSINDKGHKQPLTCR